MTTTVAHLSRGPVLVERAVHIIFVPDGVAGVDAASDALPTDAQLAEAANYSYIGSPAETDVIVFARRPWHYVDGKLRKHPEVHHDYPNTVLELDVARGEKVLWWSERDFTITQIAGHSAADANAPNPFASMPVTRPETGVDHLTPTTIHVARAPVPIETARGHEYKITFTSGGQRIDPNMRCN
jgi:hypothetical protein